MRATCVLSVTAVLCALAATVAPLAAAQAEADVVLALDAGAEPVVTRGADLVRSARHEAGESVELELEGADRFLLVEMRVTGWFDVPRAEQILPRFNDSFFARLRSDPSTTSGSSLVLNATGTPRDLLLRLGIPARDPDGNAWTVRALRLTRDVEPPRFTLGEVTNLTHYSFLYRTTTDEYAIADVRIRPTAGGEEVENPTPVLSLHQTFPIQGLDADTPYTFHVRFTDWSGNVAESERMSIRTLPEPVRPLPRITRVAPEPDARLAPGPVTIEAAFESFESPVGAGGVRLFFDKREIEQHLFAVAGGVATFAPSDALAPGLHSASVEVTNEAGGLARRAWSFTVEAPNARESPLAGALALAAAGIVAAAALARRPRKQP